MSTFDDKLNTFMNELVSYELMTREECSDSVRQLFEKALINSGFKSTTRAKTTRQTKETTGSVHVPSSTSTAQAVTTTKTDPPAPKKLSGYNLFTKLTHKYYKDNSKELNINNVSTLWKSLTKESKDLFNDSVKSLNSLDEVTSVLETNLRKSIPLTDFDNSKEKQYTALVKKIKKQDSNYTSIPWSKVTDDYLDKLYSEYDDDGNRL